jgi:hypothetical protein
MATGTCPECGSPVSAHDGWGGPAGCSLTDNGAAARIAQYQADQDSAANPRLAGRRRPWTDSEIPDGALDRALGSPDEQARP